MVDQNLDQPSSDSVHGVENALSSLWDKAREASLLISTLREEKKHLAQRIGELEDELRNARHDTAELQSQFDAARSTAAAKTSSVDMEEDEKRMLQQKLRSVISKLDQYLTQ
jgi:chromosome segregation ATPase